MAIEKLGDKKVTSILDPSLQGLERFWRVNEQRGRRGQVRVGPGVAKTLRFYRTQKWNGKPEGQDRRVQLGRGSFLWCRAADVPSLICQINDNGVVLFQLLALALAKALGVGLLQRRLNQTSSQRIGVNEECLVAILVITLALALAFCHATAIVVNDAGVDGDFGHGGVYPVGSL